MSYFDEFEKIENKLRKMESEDLLYRYGAYKMFQGDEGSAASPLAHDIDIESKLIYKILMERLYKVEGK